MCLYYEHHPAGGIPIFWQIPSFETPLPTRSKTNIPVARLEFQCLFDRPAEAAQFVGW